MADEQTLYLVKTGTRYMGLMAGTELLYGPNELRTAEEVAKETKGRLTCRLYVHNPEEDEVVGDFTGG